MQEAKERAGSVIRPYPMYANPAMSRRGRPPHPDILTPREWEVLDLLRESLTNQQIAVRLGITPNGAKYHVSEILTKIGVGTREGATAWRPERRPWWLAAAAPVLPWRKLGFGWLAPAPASGRIRGFGGARSLKRCPE